MTNWIEIPYFAPHFRTRIQLSKKEFSEVILLCFRCIELNIVSWTEGLLALDQELYLPEKENSCFSNFFKLLSKDQVSPEILTSIENKINDPLVKAYTLVELCSVYMTYKNIEDGEEVSKLLLSLYFIIDPENPKFNEFLFLLLERISAKHKYSVHHYWKVKKMKGDNSIKLTVKDIEEGLLSDLLEHKKIIESSWIPEGIPSPNDMIRLWEEFGSASKKGSLSQVELDEMFEQ